MRIAIFLLFVIGSCEGDFLDGLTDSISNGLSNAANWVRETANPAIREKYTEYKETLQDPETHKAVRQWVQEKAETASEFAKNDIYPELKKIYDAATADSGESKSEIKLDE